MVRSVGQLQIRGSPAKADAEHVALDFGQFDHVTSAFDFDRSTLDVHSFTAVNRARCEWKDRAHVDLQDWKVRDASSVSGLFSVRGGDLHALAAQGGINIPATGALAAMLHVTGSSIRRS